MRFFRKKVTTELPERRRVSQESGGFQRNRTITGALSDSVYSASTTSAHLESPRTKVHSLRQVRRRVGLLMLGAIGFVTLFGILLTQYVGSVRVTSADTSLSGDFKPEQYAGLIQEYFGPRFLERFRFSVNQDGLLGFMQAKYPEIATIKSIQGDDIGSASIALSFRKPVASWLIGDKTYYVDARGEAFEKNYYSGAYVKIIDESGVSVDNGSVIASGRFLGFVGRAVSSALEYTYTVTEARIPAGTTRELEIKLAEASPAVRMSVDRPAGEQTEDMVSALRYLKSVGRTPTYIDVRVSGKAFYQ